VSPEMMADKHAALDHVETVRRQLDELTRMVKSDAYCVEVMKQIQAVKCSLDRANRVTLHKHLETCFSEAVLYGRGQTAIDELIDAVKFTPAPTGLHTRPNGSAVGQSATNNSKQLLAATTFSLPGIASRACKAALEAIVTPIAGVAAVEVHLPTKTITVHHDHRAPTRALIEAIEEQGYHVADPFIAAPAEKGARHAGLGFVDGDGI
jgi:DNA-binding FrmR family transcriptional regulator/copper chaperone CopZ